MTKDDLITYLSSMDANATEADFWPITVAFVADWIEIRGDDCSSQEIADEWREEMGA